ncbi:hypothetical protein DSO57_1037490 [Entomophthora muscae]|uniref:Uncharacterized protein n=1 Tax=Entomophthora muscae TaxID=34485 RepID=A0ACC2SN10_9FUNG|nr:hypothetical protein DSO57_1037490 [Entomophthora muscae]
MSAVYTTPLDFIITNISPLLVGPLLLESHPVTIWFYFSEAIINTVVTHGGYTFFGFPNADMHDSHHETFNNMFGVIGLLDYLHGTDIKFKERIASAKVKNN